MEIGKLSVIKVCPSKKDTDGARHKMPKNCVLGNCLLIAVEGKSATD
jgi:hypothetical protein